ncbi:MAG: hypothetical protein ACRD3N_11730 [Terracidiphilus sp.]
MSVVRGSGFEDALGFFSWVSVAAAVLETHQTGVLAVVRLNEVVVGSFVCSLLYWVVSFAQSEERRREFTPRMQAIVLAMAGTARAYRVALAKPNDA